MPGADLPPVNSIATDDDEELVNAFILSLVNRYSPSNLSFPDNPRPLCISGLPLRVCPLGLRDALSMYNELARSVTLSLHSQLLYFFICSVSYRFNYL